MNHKIIIAGKYQLKLVSDVTISKSIENLMDTAIITLPRTHLNKNIPLKFNIEEGDTVEINLGYSNNLRTEFKGYINRITTDDGVIQFECQDELYLFDKPLTDVALTNITLKDLLKKVCDEVNTVNKTIKYKVECSYAFTWEKFVFSMASGVDVLKKVQEETKANIFFLGDTLYVQAPYQNILNDKVVVYDFSKNVEKSELKYVRFKDKKIQIVIKYTDIDGKAKEITYGRTGGEKKEIKMSAVSEASMQARAKNEYNLYAYDGFEGSFTEWLLLLVEPCYKIQLIDPSDSEKTGFYYVTAVETKFSRAGGERKISIGRRI